MAHTALVPGTPAPALEVPLVSGGTWSLKEQSNPFMTLIDVYRGYHCPRCRAHLITLAHCVARFQERGVGVLAVSMDPKDRAEKTAAEWGIDGLPLGYGMTEEQARAWGLYVSESFQTKETERFAEPGIFLVQADGTLYSVALNSTPFFRTHVPDILEAVDMIKARSYPPRGTLAAA